MNTSYSLKIEITQDFIDNIDPDDCHYTYPEIIKPLINLHRIADQTRLSR